MLQKLKFFILDDTVYISILILLVASSSFAFGRLSAVESPFGVKIPTKEATFSLKSTNFAGLLSTSTTSTIDTKSPTLLLSAPTTTELSAIASNIAPNKAKFVASKSGTKYHLLTCPGAKTIKDTNKIYFTTVQEAESAGYAKASNCPGL